MITQISYNVIIERFKAFAEGHYLIKGFTHGDPSNVNIEKGVEFPWMHVFPVEVEPRAGSRLYSFIITFADLPRDKETPPEYQREVLSDCIRLAEDLLAEVQNGLTVFGPTVEIDGTPNIEVFINEYSHTLTGVNLALTLSVPWDWSACDIPADWSVGGTGSGGSGVGVGLILRVNGVDNVQQDLLDLVQGDNVTITDLGNGSVRIDATGGTGSINWGAIGGTLSNQTDLATALGLKANTADLGAVAFSNDYNDLDNLPTIPAAQVNSDWSATTGVAKILNKPFIPTLLDDLTDVNTAGEVFKNVLYYNGTTWIPYMLSAVAYSGSYNDLSNKPTIPKTIGDLVGNGSATNDIIIWNGSAWVVSAIPNPKLNLGDLQNVNASAPNPGDVLYWDDVAGEWINYQLHPVAYSGDYNDLGNKPTIPAAQIQSDWTQANTAALDYIKNKPTLPATVGDMLKSVYDTDNDGIVDFAEALKTEVRNSTGATLYKGYIVYLSGSTGNLPNAVAAQANSDATSAQTFGVVISDIANNSNGFVVTLGQIADLDTRSTATNPFTADTLVDGEVVYLSPTTPGWITRTKPVAPQHMVYVGMVVRTSPTNGTIQYRIQNGYELDELHNVVATAPANNDYLYYDGSTSLWRTRALNTTVVTNGSTVGGTTTTDALNNLNSGKVNANSAITGATNTKITYDAKGLVTAGTSLVASDLPAHTHTASQISDSSTVGQNLIKLTNPSAISYLRINADNTVTALTLAQLKAAVGDTVPYGIVVLSTVPASSTRYAAIAGGFATTLDANVANRQFTIPIGGTVKNLYITTSNLQSATGSLVCAVNKNGVGSGVSVTFTSADGAGATKSDTTNTLSVVAGDKLTISFVNNATATSATVVSAAFIIERI